MSNIIIYGSCVTRDAFELVKEDHTLLAYVARQSLISAMGRRTQLLQGPNLVSNFQNRMLSGDLASNLVPTIRGLAHEVDAIVMDLTDERLGVHKLPDGSFVTHSKELASSGRLEQLDPVPGIIWPNNDRYQLFWEQSAKKFADQLKQLDQLHRTILIHTPWATETTSGNDVGTPGRFSVADFNAVMEQQATVLSGLGINVIRMPPELALAGEDHRWGLAPFHFDSAATRWIAAQIDSV